MDVKRKRKECYSLLKVLENRETGQPHLKQDTLTSKYYKHFKMLGNQVEEHGAIFNLEFSPSGKMLVAACEASAVLLYDLTCRTCRHKLPNAHSDSVNCICFCDERIFASGSDDCTIALWDARMLNEHIMKLSGHMGWVKSLVYEKNTGFLLSSAFDGTVRAWDINRSQSSSKEGLKATVLVEKDKVSRMQLTPEGDKLIVSFLDSEQGCDVTLIFHNLDLLNFVDDIMNDRCNQIHAEFSCDENCCRNIPERLDTILDYPKWPLCIPSFEVHPHGTCLASRYLTEDNRQFTTIHNIQSSSYGKG